MIDLWDIGIALTIVGLFVGLISIIAEIHFRDFYIPPIAISIIMLIIGILLVKFNGGFSLLFHIS